MPDAKTLLDNYETSWLAWGKEACFTMDDVDVVRARIEELEKLLRNLTNDCDCWNAVTARRRACEALEKK